MKYFLAFALLLLALPVLATSIVYVSNEDSVNLSELILVGRVISVETGYDSNGQIVRNVRIQVNETLKGKITGDTFTFRAWGGSIDGVKDEAIGEARYKAGEKILVQLENIDGQYHTLGLSFGKWNVVRDNAGREKIKRDLSGLTVVNSSNLRVVADMDLQDMRDLVSKLEKAKVK